MMDASSIRNECPRVKGSNDPVTIPTDATEYEKMSKANNPYGDGKACERIINKILKITK
jgi:hypothetical protein